MLITWVSFKIFYVWGESEFVEFYARKPLPGRKENQNDLGGGGVGGSDLQVRQSMPCRGIRKCPFRETLDGNNINIPLDTHIQLMFIPSIILSSVTP